MATSDYKKAVANLEAAIGWESLASQEDFDFPIKDIWGIFPFLESPQNYYFVGSRGAGKSALVTQSVQLLENDKQVLLCALNGASFRSIGDSAHIETVKKFITGFFATLLDQIRIRKNYERIARISTTYAWVREWRDFREWREYLSSIIRQETDSKSQIPALFGKSHLRLLIDVASIRFALLDAGPIQVGSFKLTPIKMSFDAPPDKRDLLFRSEEVRNSLNTEIGFIEPVLSSLVNELAQHCQNENINKIVILVDDFHFLSLASQVRIIHFLRRVIGQLRSKNITMILKIFSATNLTPYIRGVLGLAKKELEVRNIESSLENLEIKRQAIENLLVLILRKSDWADDDIRRLFRREIIDLILVLSGGHPRRFLEMSAVLIGNTQGNLGNLYDDVMFAAATILNEYRNNLHIQLGIDEDPRANEYQRVYEKSVSHLTEHFASVDNPFILVPYSEIQGLMDFAQWLDDAVAIGDLLEIVNLVWIGREPYRLVALNPATMYYRRYDFRIRYHDIVDIQIGAREIQNKYSLTH
jgi:hypothetical protein